MDRTELENLYILVADLGKVVQHLNQRIRTVENQLRVIADTNDLGGRYSSVMPPRFEAQWGDEK